MVDAAAAFNRSQVISNNYIDLVSYTLLYYDYALTLPAEVDRFWSTQSLSLTSAFFYLNRYLSLFGHIPAFVRDFWTFGAETCTLLALYHQYFILVIQIIVGILFIIRTYALYDRNLRVLLFLCACAVAGIIYAIWTIVAGHDTNAIVINPQMSCTPPLDRQAADIVGDAWIAMLMFDMLIFSMTVYKSWRRGDRVRKSVFGLLLRDGAIYFGIIAIIELVTVITFHPLPVYQRGATATLASIVASIMISRLMLNLRDPRYLTRSTRPTSRSPSTLVFNVAASHATSTTSNNARC